MGVIIRCRGVVVGYERVAEGGISRRIDEEQRDKERDRRVRETSGSESIFICWTCFPPA